VIDIIYGLAGLGLACFTIFLVWLNWQILQVSRQILNISISLLEETIIIKEETVFIRKVSQVIEKETILSRKALVGDNISVLD